MSYLISSNKSLTLKVAWWNPLNYTCFYIRHEGNRYRTMSQNFVVWPTTRKNYLETQTKMQAHTLLKYITHNLSPNRKININRPNYRSVNIVQ